MNKIVLSLLISSLIMKKVFGDVVASAPSSSSSDRYQAPQIYQTQSMGSYGYPNYQMPVSTYGNSYGPYGPYNGYPSPYNNYWYQGPVDSVQAQGARALMQSSNNAAVLNTIRNNNFDLLYGPQQVLGTDIAVDRAMNYWYGGPISGYDYYYGTGYNPSQPYGSYGSYGYGSYGGFDRPGSVGAAFSGSSELQRQLAEYVAGNSYIGTSAQVYDETWRAQAQFTNALSNVASQQRAAHELAYASSALPYMF